MANLYGAYRGASRAGFDYSSTLQRIMDVGYEQEHSKQMFDIGQEKSDRAFAFGQQALGLLSTYAGGEVDQEEAAADIERAGKIDYESQFGENESFTAWEELTSDEKSKYAPVQTYGETKIGDVVNPFKIADDMTWAGRAKWLGGTGENIKWEGFGKAPGLDRKGETAWGEIGERLGVLTGIKERKWELGGKTYKQSDMLAKSQQTLYDELGIKTP